MTVIKGREDIYTLVAHFYQKVRKDELIGPIFNGRIPDAQWPAHLERLTDFWETNLLGKIRFKGNPMPVHISVDASNEHQISQLHFHRWLELWFASIDTLFEGVLAQRAKDGARRMATGLFMGIAKNKPQL